MAQKRFAEGDVAGLNSGGPNMMVSHDVEGAVRCLWIDHGDIRIADFRRETLTLRLKRAGD